MTEEEMVGLLTAVFRERHGTKGANPKPECKPDDPREEARILAFPGLQRPQERRSQGRLMSCPTKARWRVTLREPKPEILGNAENNHLERRDSLRSHVSIAFYDAGLW
jgi:hypothetical protein